MEATAVWLLNQICCLAEHRGQLSASLIWQCLSGLPKAHPACIALEKRTEFVAWEHAHVCVHMAAGMHYVFIL